MTIEILHDLCRSCDACVTVCPHLALWMEGSTLTWRAPRCRDCGDCVLVCPADALVAHRSEDPGA